MIFHIFLTFILSNIYIPNENSIQYINSNLNFSWVNNFEETNLNLFLLQDEIIVKYPNNTNILTTQISNIGYYNWIPPYELNKYNIDGINFKFLLSNSNDPYSATLGHSQNNLLNNNFYFKTNVNISSPSKYDILIPNNNIIIK